MDPKEMFGRAMDRLEAAYDREELTDEEYRAEMRELQAEYRGAAAEAAQHEHDRWFE